MRKLGVLVAGILTMSAAQPSVARPVTPALVVRIIPTSFQQKTGRVIQLNPLNPQFYVVVTNKSRSPVRLWRDWSSWGYKNLSFVVTNATGKSVVTKVSKNFSRNFADWSSLNQDDSMVFAVSFDQNEWNNAPLPEQGAGRTIRIKAVYEIPADMETERYGVWTGRITSPTESYTIQY